MKRRVLVLLAIFAALSLPGIRAQTAISWGSPTTISGDTDILNAGSFIWAYDFTHVNTSASPTINGVAFTNTPYTTNDDLSQNGYPIATGVTFGNVGSLYGQDNAFVSSTAPFANLSSYYQTLLGAGAYWTGANGSITLDHSLLVQGQQYEVEIWVNDPRAGAASLRSETIDDGLGNSVNLAFNSIQDEGGVGQYVTGTFTAGSSDPVIDLTVLTGNTTQIEAMSLQAIPEPSAYAAIFGVLALGAAAVREYRRGKLAA